MLKIVAETNTCILNSQSSFVFFLSTEPSEGGATVQSVKYTHTHTHTHNILNIYTYMCVCIYIHILPFIQAEVIGLAFQEGSLKERQPEMVHVPFSLLTT